MESFEDETEHVNIDNLFDGMSLVREDCVYRWGLWLICSCNVSWIWCGIWRGDQILMYTWTIFGSKVWLKYGIEGVTVIGMLLVSEYGIKYGFILNLLLLYNVSIEYGFENGFLIIPLFLL